MRLGDGHPSEAAGHPTAHAADPRAGQRAPPANRWSPSYLALLLVELAAFHPDDRSRRYRHCGAGPRLAADGCYPLPRAVELGLSSTRSVARSRRGHPAASLTRSILAGGFDSLELEQPEPGRDLESAADHIEALGSPQRAENALLHQVERG